MRWLLVVCLVACKSEKKPADDMDEKMRHCPVALDGAESKLSDIEGGVQFEIKVPAEKVAEVQRRAHHVVEFAAKRVGKHGGGSGGGTMRNCPIVTSDVVIAAEDLPDGARVKITSDNAMELRAETRRRVVTFPFVGATIHE